MNEFHFLRPWWLLGLLAILAWPLLRHWLQQASGWSRVLAPHLLKPLTGEQYSAAKQWPLLTLFCGWSILCLSLAGPAWERIPMPVYQQERGIVLVMDMSMNTRASDLSPDRLTRLRYKALDILDEVEGAQVGIIAYAGDAFAISPLTYDFSNIRTMIPALSPEIMPVSGNYPLLAMQEAHRMFTDSGIQHGEIIWLSAGMNNDDYQDLQQYLRGKNHRLSALIAGTDERAPIRLADGNIMRDSMGRIQMAHINPRDFERLTRAHNGVAVRLRADDQDIQQLLAQGPRSTSLTETEDELVADEWLDRGPYLAWLLIPLVLLVIRRGVIMSICLLPLLWSALPPAAYAASAPVAASPGRAWQTPFQNQSQRAEQLYQQGDYEQAARLFNDPRRQGDAWYRAGDYDQALNAYQRAEDSADTWFNRGNALAQTGQYAAAQEAYEKALESRPDWTEAMDNKTLMEQLQEEEQERGGSDDDTQSSDDQASEEQQNDEQQTQDDDSASDDQSSDADHEQQEQNPQDAESDATADDAQQSADDETATEDEMTQPEPSDSMDQDTPEEAIHSALMNDDLSDEEREELEQLLRRVQSDPAQLLYNRMRLEAQRRQYSQPPRGVR